MKNKLKRDVQLFKEEKDRFDKAMLKFVKRVEKYDNLEE